MSAIRPKPWELNPAPAELVGDGPSSAIPSTSATDGPPSRPTEPVLLNDPSDLQSGMQSGIGNSTYNPGGLNSGMGGYGGYGNYGGYGGGGYSGGYGTGYGTGYGSYGGYGAMGGGYGGYGMGSMNRFGAGGMNGPNSIQNSTMATFQLIESMVGAFGGFAQMLESTYMATHSSFFAMMSVADQFGRLKQSLGSILGIFAILRWGRSLLAKLTGRSVPQTSRSLGLTPSQFAKFNSAGGATRPPRPSFKPLLVFLTAVFGLPYLLGKLIRHLADQQQREQLTQGGQGAIDPSQLQFCRALYDFVPENPQVEVELKKGDLAAVLSSSDPSGKPSQWWRVRTRDGRSGYVPATYVQIIPKDVSGPSPEQSKGNAGFIEYR